MLPRISIKGSVRPSVGPSVGWLVTLSSKTREINSFEQNSVIGGMISFLDGAVHGQTDSGSAKMGQFES